MKHLGALIIKYIMVAVILELVLMNMTRLSFGSTLVVSLAITLITYLIGDIWILRKTTNIIATLVNLVLSLITIYVFNFIYYRPGITFISALLSAVIVGIGEWFYHKFLYRLFDWSEEKEHPAAS